MRNILKIHVLILLFLVLSVPISSNSLANDAKKREKVISELHKIGTAYMQNNKLPDPSTVENIITVIGQVSNVPPVFELLKFSYDVRNYISHALKVPDAVYWYIGRREKDDSPEAAFNDLWEIFQDTGFKKIGGNPPNRKAFIAYAETVYIAKRYVSDTSVSSQANKWARGEQSRERRPPLPNYGDGVLLKSSRPEVYVIQGGKRHWIPDPATFKAMGYDWNKIVVIPDRELEQIPRGPDIPRRR